MCFLDNFREIFVRENNRRRLFSNQRGPPLGFSKFAIYHRIKVLSTGQIGDVKYMLSFRLKLLSNGTSAAEVCILC